MDIVTGVGVLDKAVHVLRAVAEAPRSLADLQQATGLPRATAHRLAVALEEHGLLRRDEEGRFDLGPELSAVERVADAGAEELVVFYQEDTHVGRRILPRSAPFNATTGSVEAWRAAL